MNSSSLQTVNAVNIIGSQLCVLNSYSTYIAILLATVVIFSTLLFAYQAHSTFQNIIRLYPTISSYCSDRRGYGSRYIMAVTFTIGYLLNLLLIEEEQIRSITYMSFTPWQKIQFYLQLVVNLCFPLLALFYVQGKGPLQNQYYRLGTNMKLPIILSEWIHNLSALGWLTVTIFYNTNFAFQHYYIITATKTETTLPAMAYLISALIVLISFIVWYSILNVLYIYADEFDDNLTYYCPDCTPNELYKSGQSFFKLTNPIDKNACQTCLRSTPTQSGSINVVNGNIELHMTIECQEKREEKKSTVRQWFKLHLLPTIEYKTYTKLHVYCFLTESIAFFGTALLAMIGSILRKRYLCEQIGFGF